MSLGFHIPAGEADAIVAKGLIQTGHAMDQRSNRIRVLVAKPGLDGHDRGAKVIARALRDTGMEVIYTGLRQTPQMIVETADQEDVDVIGLSILSGAHLEIFLAIIDGLRKKEMSDVTVIAGGIIPDSDRDVLLQAGVKAIFGPGTSTQDIVNFIHKAMTDRDDSRKLG